MAPLSRCVLLLAAFSIPPTLLAQDRGVEIGMDGGFEYAFDADLFTVAIPFQRSADLGAQFLLRTAFHQRRLGSRTGCPGRSAVCAGYRK